MYILQNNDNNKYVAHSGSEHSYTNRLEQARVFKTKESAQKHACGNETILHITDVLNRSDDSMR